MKGPEQQWLDLQGASEDTPEVVRPHQQARPGSEVAKMPESKAKVGNPVAAAFALEARYPGRIFNYNGEERRGKGKWYTFREEGVEITPFKPEMELLVAQDGTITSRPFRPKGAFAA